MQPRQITESADIAACLRLIRANFAYMDGRIDPPTSMHRLTAEDLATAWEVWGIGAPPEACVVLTPKSDALYLGKFAMAQAARGTGHARRLVALAESRAKALGRAALELETRIELTEVHAAFPAMGFEITGRTAHPGFERPISLTMRKTL
jgi:GNAT superfamily N-acetyltransferase